MSRKWVPEKPGTYKHYYDHYSNAFKRRMVTDPVSTKVTRGNSGLRFTIYNEDYKHSVGQPITVNVTLGFFIRPTFFFQDDTYGR